MNFTPAKTVVSLVLSATIVLGVGASVVSSASESDARVTTTTVSESTKLATPAGAAAETIHSEKEVTTGQTHLVTQSSRKTRDFSGASRHISQTTDTTTPGMPAEPVEQQKNLETNIEAGEHLNGTDYDLPTGVAEYETPSE